ncbi:MAG: DUF1659 domain-containing protein [Peptostreptococcaceae bacterium]
MEYQRQVTDVTEINNASSLKIKFDCGLGENGKNLIKSRTYSYLKPDADPVDVYNVADALASLQKHTLMDVIKQDNTTLVSIS